MVAVEQRERTEPTSGPSLRLITRGGPFDRSVRSHGADVVVYTSAH